MILAGGGNKCDEDASGGGNVDHSHDNDKKNVLTPNCCFKSHIGETWRHNSLCLILCVV